MRLFFEFFRRLIYWIPNYPQTIQIGITNVCNFDCKICQRHDLSVDIKNMEYDLFEEIVDKIDFSKTNDLILTGWGEPMCHPNFLKMIAKVSFKDVRVRFTTNGSLLTEDKAKHILFNNVDAVTFSIDELESNEESIGHCIKDQLRNIENFIKLRDEQKKSTKVFLQTTYSKNGEDNIIDIIDYSEKNNINCVKISRLDIRFKKFDRPSLQEEKDFVNRVEKYIKNKKVNVTFLPHLAFNGVLKELYKVISPWLHLRGKYCLRTYSDIYINVNGQITPCCALPRHGILDVRQNSIKEIWKSKKFKEFRKKQNVICGVCDVLKINYHE